MPPGERGVALLEALVALTIFAVAGLATIEAAHEGLRSERRMQVLERRQVAAARKLAVYALLEERELSRRIGEQAVGEFVLRVQRPTPTLFRIAVADSASPEHEELVTVVYRPRGAP